MHLLKSLQYFILCICYNHRIYHYIWIVDVLGHVGSLEEALKFTSKIPINLELGVYMCVLAACKSNIVASAGYLENHLLYMV